MCNEFQWKIFSHSFSGYICVCIYSALYEKKIIIKYKNSFLHYFQFSLSLTHVSTSKKCNLLQLNLPVCVCVFCLCVFNVKSAVTHRCTYMFVYSSSCWMENSRELWHGVLVRIILFFYFCKCEEIFERILRDFQLRELRLPNAFYIHMQFSP